MSYDPTNRSFQFILLQNKAYHEEYLIGAKAYMNTKPKDQTNFYFPAIPSKKRYLQEEKNRIIEKENNNLLKRMRDIIIDRKAQIFKQYNKESSYEFTKESPNTPIQVLSHPFFGGEKTKSLNMSFRRKENARINHDNLQFLKRLRESKPIVSSQNDIKSHINKQKEIQRNIRNYDTNHRPKSVITIYDRKKLNSVLDGYIRRHEEGEIKSPKSLEKLNMGANNQRLLDHNEDSKELKEKIVPKSNKTRSKLDVRRSQENSKLLGNSQNLQRGRLYRLNLPPNATAKKVGKNLNQLSLVFESEKSAVTVFAEGPNRKSYSPQLLEKFPIKIDANQNDIQIGSLQQAKENNFIKKYLSDNTGKVVASNPNMIFEADQSHMTFARPDSHQEASWRHKISEKDLANDIHDWEANIRMLESNYLGTKRDELSNLSTNP